MESPLHIGDVTTNSISNKLDGTHLNPSVSASVSSSTYAGQKFIQLTLALHAHERGSSPSATTTAPLDDSLIILRRVQDSYVNVSQLLSVLVKLGHFSDSKLTNFLNNEIVNNAQFTSSPSAAASATTPENHSRGLSIYNDLRNHRIHNLKGLWIPYDKSVSLALKFDIYEFVKQLFLIDVHDFDNLPTSNTDFHGQHKRGLFDDEDQGDIISPPHSANASLMGSPSKKQKTNKYTAEPEVADKASSQSNLIEKERQKNHALITKAIKSNVNHPFTLPPITISDKNFDVISDVKLKFGEVFKRDDGNSKISFKEVNIIFQPIISEFSHPFEQLATTDIPLDESGKTALHFAATLGSLNLVSSFIKLGISSPIRGTSSGESPLISAIKVTNSMENGQFSELLGNWLWPNIWLLDNDKKSFLHVLVLQSIKNSKSSRFYLTKILEWIFSPLSFPDQQNGPAHKNHKMISDLCFDLINTQDELDGNTALHIAAENESRWFVAVLLQLNADVNIENKMGVKPIDFSIVSEIIQQQQKPFENHASAFEGDSDDDYIIQLVRTSVEFIKKRKEVEDFDISDQANDIDASKSAVKQDSPSATLRSGDDSFNANTNLLSNKIFQSIQDLLSNTNNEYETIINGKRKQINDLNKQLHDSTLITANNRFVTRKITEKLSYLDTLKLQMTNINDKYELLKKESPGEKGSEEENKDQNDEKAIKRVSADDAFVIAPIYDKIVANEDIDKKALLADSSFMDSLPPKSELKARNAAYKKVNQKLQEELSSLSDYTDLTSKFKKVVSFCTGVDVNEVDELLDGLLEAVESQQ